jgi:hypothetical protein
MNTCTICLERKACVRFTTCLECENQWCLECESHVRYQSCPFCRTPGWGLPTASVLTRPARPARFNALPASTVVPPGSFVIVAAADDLNENPFN